jgi:hypothetical protein
MHLPINGLPESCSAVKENWPEHHLGTDYIPIKTGKRHNNVKPASGGLPESQEGRGL